jgi:hypothetical protein
MANFPLSQRKKGSLKQGADRFMPMGGELTVHPGLGQVPPAAPPQQYLVEEPQQAITIEVSGPSAFQRPFTDPPRPIQVPVTAVQAGRRGMTMGQPPALPAPPAERPSCPVGPVEMPDGRIIEPDDPVTLRDMCEIVSSMVDALVEAQGAPAAGALPGQAVTVVGGVPAAAPAVPGYQSFGQPSGGGGGGNGAFISGGGGGPGPKGDPGPAGPQGPAGPAGSSAQGSAVVDFVSKTDGDFSLAGMPFFVPVPGTQVSFNQSVDGPAVFLLQAVYVGDALGIDQGIIVGVRIDGVDNGLVHFRFQGSVPGVTVTREGLHGSLAAVLAAGTHTVEVIMRTDISPVATIAATPDTPLILTVLHR